jgi:hypothetical protein
MDYSNANKKRKKKKQQTFPATFARTSFCSHPFKGLTFSEDSGASHFARLSHPRSFQFTIREEELAKGLEL